MKSFVRVIAIFVISLSAFQLWAQDREARIVKYHDKDIVHLTTRPKFTTLVILPDRERILDFVIGDKDNWVLEGSQNFAYLKPTKEGESTSVTLVTAQGNVYSFYATSADFGNPDLKVFIEPVDEKILGGIGAPPKFIPASELDDLRLAAQAQIEAAREDKDRFQSEYPVKNVIWDYKFKKDKKPFKITAIYHDDKFTYIRSSAQEKPTLYEVKDGKPNLINFDLRDGVYVTPKIIDEGYLTVGKHKTTFKRIAY